jgi:hypothetical protein
LVDPDGLAKKRDDREWWLRGSADFWRFILGEPPGPGGSGEEEGYVFTPKAIVGRNTDRVMLPCTSKSALMNFMTALNPRPAAAASLSLGAGIGLTARDNYTEKGVNRFVGGGYGVASSANLVFGFAFGKEASGKASNLAVNFGHIPLGLHGRLSVMKSDSGTSGFIGIGVGALGSAQWTVGKARRIATFSLGENPSPCGY